MTAQLEYPDLDDSEALLSIQGLWKVFGPKAARVPRRPELAGLTRSQLLHQTGCTAAVRDLSFDVVAGTGDGPGRAEEAMRCLAAMERPDGPTVAWAGISQLCVAQRAGERPGQCLGPVGEVCIAAGGHQDLIVQGAAQLAQGPAHRRLRHVEGLRRARDALS